jgi:hypothetical protein
MGASIDFVRLYLKVGVKDKIERGESAYSRPSAAIGANANREKSL